MNNSRTAQSVSDELFELNSRDVQETTTMFEDFTALIKTGIINSNLMTAFTGVWLALYYTNQSFLSQINSVIFALLGTAFVIAGGCTLNNYIDRDIDHIMERTKKRPTVTGKITPRNVLLLGLFFSTFGTILLLQASFMAALLGLIGLFAYVILYTLWTKRQYTINTVVGSISGAVPPLIGWAAVDPNLHPAAWILFLIMFIWQPPHFLALAMKKTEEYRAAGIPMLPVVHGFAMTKRQIVLYIACLLPLPYYLYSLGTVFLVVATVLNVGWLVLGFYGFKMKDDLKWARIMFVYSLQYLTIMFVLMVIVTISF